MKYFAVPVLILLFVLHILRSLILGLGFHFATKIDKNSFIKTCFLKKILESKHSVIHRLFGAKTYPRDFFRVVVIFQILVNVVHYLIRAHNYEVILSD